MSRPLRFQQAQQEIENFLNKQTTTIFTAKDMANFLHQGKQYSKLPESYSVRKFIDQTVKYIDIKEKIISFPYRSYKRYVWKDTSKYQLYISFVKNSFFTHQTALYLHQLINYEPNTIYINFEQSKKPKAKGQLTQEGIDMAFENCQRMTKNIATFNKDKISLPSKLDEIKV